MASGPISSQRRAAVALFYILRGPPIFIRSDSGPEFVARAVRDWIAAVGAQTAYIEPGSPWENGYIESFNARLLTAAVERRTVCGAMVFLPCVIDQVCGALKCGWSTR